MTLTVTPRLGILMMATSMAQKEQVFNEAILAFDALFSGTAIAIQNAPPSSPSDGDTYIIGTSPTGAWAGYANKLAFSYNGWQFITVPEQYRIYDVGTSSFYVYTTSGGWSAVAAGTPTNLTDLADVNAASPANGDILTYDNSTHKWVNLPPSTPTTTLHALTDVSVTEGSGIDGYVLKWNNGVSKWEAVALTAPTTTFAALTDVDATSFGNGKIATWSTTTNKVEFVSPSSLAVVSALNQVGDVTYSPSLATNDALVWNGAAWAPSSTAIKFKFENMTDGPGTLVGAAGKILIVNSLETALEYADLSTWLATAGVQLSTLADVSVTEGSGIDGHVLYWNNGATKWEALALATVATSGAYSDLSGKPTIPTTLAALTDVSVTEGSGINNWLLAYNNGASKWEAVSPSAIGVTTLAALTDVSVTEGSGINNWLLAYNNGASKWEAVNPSTIGATTLAALTDVGVTEGSGIDGLYLKWDNATSKWVASSVSAGIAVESPRGVVSDVTGARAFGTVYQNTTDAVLAVTISGTGAGADTLEGDISLTSGFSTTIIAARDTGGETGAGIRTIFMLVPPGLYYKATQGGGTLSNWVETIVQVPFDPQINDVTGSRAIGTVYQNTSPYPLFVNANVYKSAAGTLSCWTTPGSTPTSGTAVAIESAASGYYANGSFIVPPGWHYEVTVDTGNTLNAWTETLLPGVSAPADTTVSKSLATIYQNTTGGYLLVSIPHSVNGLIVQASLSSALASPITVAQNSCSSTWANTLYALIPPGYYYEVTSQSGTTAVPYSWHELAVTIGTPPSALSAMADVNVTEGSGIDGYVLTWNNVSGKWIASAGGGGGGSFSLGPHKYWRLKNLQGVPNAFATASAAEIGFRATSGGANQTTTSVSASSEYSGAYSPDKAVDADTTTWWVSGSYDYSPWFEAYFSSAVTVEEIAITARTDSPYFNQTPTSFELFYSDDGLTYFLACMLNTPTAYTAGSQQLFEVPTTIP